uniref:Delta(24)-sterol reductase n=1 Tax=Phallusia mammillata TaxID=59560 RepID=A0A6F9DBH6_9ASCI|nr:delta(24)-sterol reductase-like [Phallusia mammillata]
MAGKTSWFVRLLEEYRGWVILFFCLPASFVFDLCLKASNWIRRSTSSPQLHDKRVRKIQDEVREWNEQPESAKQPMCTSRPNWLSLSTTFFQKSKCHKIGVMLFDILKLDEEKMTVKVEPLVSVGEITSYLVPKGYTLAVTLEIADATCGGLALAVGMTTYSHKVGLYQESVVSYDIILGNGDLVHVTKDNEHKDLFYCLPWSHGTLGFLVAVELKIVPVKPFVHLKYIPVNGQNNYCNEIRKLSGALDKDADTPDYLETMVFSKNEAVILVGNFSDVTTDEQRNKINHVSKWYKPWFYKHVETFLRRGGGEEFIPLQDYLLRHNRSIFWVVEAMIPFGNHPMFRYLFGWLNPPKPAFLKFTTTPGVRAMTFTKQVFQDIVLPMTVLEKSINLAEELFDTYPILIYPCRIYNHGDNKGQLRQPRADQMCPDANYGMFYDLGVYGVPGKVKRKESYNVVETMRTMEQFIRDNGGYSFLYADIFMTREEFEVMFDLTLYRQCRKTYKADGAFPDLYDKIRPEIDVFKVGKKYAEKS